MAREFNLYDEITSEVGCERDTVKKVLTMYPYSRFDIQNICCVCKCPHDTVKAILKAARQRGFLGVTIYLK